MGMNSQTLDIKKFNISPDDLQKLLSCSELVSLKELLIGGLYSDGEDPWNAYNLKWVNHAMEAHLPDLEVFEWSSHDYGCDTVWLRPFGSFKGLTKLRRLTVDYHILKMESRGIQQEPVHLTRPHERLPRR
jgi:hypothetical protein